MSASRRENAHRLQNASTIKLLISTNRFIYSTLHLVLLNVIIATLDLSPSGRFHHALHLRSRLVRVDRRSPLQGLTFGIVNQRQILQNRRELIRGWRRAECSAAHQRARRRRVGRPRLQSIHAIISIDIHTHTHTRSLHDHCTISRKNHHVEGKSRHSNREKPVPSPILIASSALLADDVRSRIEKQEVDDDQSKQ